MTIVGKYEKYYEKYYKSFYVNIITALGWTLGTLYTGFVLVLSGHLLADD